jgi:hypothetical protein
VILFQFYLGPNNVTNMVNVVEELLDAAIYTDERRNWYFEIFVMVHTNQHFVHPGLMEFGHADIDEASKFRHFQKGIKNYTLDGIKTQIMASPALSSHFSGVVNLYTDFIKSAKAVNPTVNVYRLIN